MSNNTQKSEKLASALYLITSFFSDQEPLKWRLRTLAADLVSQKVKDKFSIAREAISLFAIAKNSGLISDTNHDIISGELSKLEKESENAFGTGFFQEEIAEKSVVLEPVRIQPIKEKTPDNKPHYLPDLPLQVKEKPLKEFGAVSVKKNSRQSVIIGLLKRKKEIMIKDVSPLISGCSEKTIQRELLAMVSAGILRKIGEKRWSRYTLA